MTLADRVQAMRLRVIHRATVLGNVTAACAEAGISRTVCSRWRRRFERYGADGLHPRRGRPPAVPPHTERLVVGLGLAWPTWGCGRLAAHLAQQGLATVSPSTVQRCRRRVGLGTRKGVGKLCQVTACDAASSYGVAQILPALSATACAAFLRDVLAPLYRQAGWPLHRVLTDDGSEFRGAFAQACRTLGIRHTRTQPRHA